MAINSRRELMEYCLRANGHPVVEINCDEEQLEDRIEDALEYWRLYHFEGDESIHMKQLITASKLNLTTPTAPTFQLNETVIGSISGALAIVTTEGPNGPNVNKHDVLLVKSVNGKFQKGETITGAKSNSTAILGCHPCILGVWDLQYITVPDLVYGITKVISFSDSMNSANNVFGIEYQMRLNDLHDISSLSLIYYTQAMNYLDLLSFELSRSPFIRFNRLQNRLHLDMNWSTDITIGSYIIVECYRALDPKEFSRIWNELWLKRYVTAQFKKQWGQNLSKFTGIALIGGATIDGGAIYQQATDEIKDLEDELMNKSAPLNFIMG
jgi:hypothetical protein